MAGHTYVQGWSKVWHRATGGTAADWLRDATRRLPALCGQPAPQANGWLHRGFIHDNEIASRYETLAGFRVCRDCQRKAARS